MDDLEVSEIALAFGFDSDDEFNDYCDEMSSEAIAAETESYSE